VIYFTLPYLTQPLNSLSPSLPYHWSLITLALPFPTVDEAYPFPTVGVGKGRARRSVSLEFDELSSEITTIVSVNKRPHLFYEFVFPSLSLNDPYSNLSQDWAFLSPA
jgi:hypothetical protein